jgi:arylsulfatase A-like enzyme
MAGPRVGRRTVLGALGAAGAAAAAGGVVRPAEAKTPAQPNVIIVLIDDLARAELGCYGNTFVETPQMDRLAADGIRFTDGYTGAPVCSPTRASLMTGQWPARTGITEFLGPSGDDFLPAGQQTLPESLRDAGYRTGLIGKWHLSETYSGEPEQRPGNPWSHGFTEVIASEQKYIAEGDYFYPYFFLPQITTQRLENEFLTARMNLEATDFIARAHSAGEPFFLYLSHYATHQELAAPQALIDKYQAKPGAGETHKKPVLAAMLEVIDDGVGAIRAQLTELGIAGNTIILVLADNGGDSATDESTPFRGAKATLYEGGTRVPMIAYHPQGAPGRVSTVPISTVDLMPTLLDAAGVAHPAGHRLDGASFAPMLTGGAAPARDTLFWVYPHWHSPGLPTASVRRGTYKLVRFLHDDRAELYDLATDLGETTNLAARLPDVTAQLQAALDAHLTDTDLLPAPPTEQNWPTVVWDQQFDDGIAKFTVAKPAPENRTGAVQAGNGVLTVASDGSPAYALLLSAGAATTSPAMITVTQKSYSNAGDQQDTLFAGLIQDAANYLLVWYNHKAKKCGWDVRLDGTPAGAAVTELAGKIDYPGPGARLTCLMKKDMLTAYAAAGSGPWQYLFTADVGRWAKLGDPAVRGRYRWGFGARVDNGTISVDRFTVRKP